MKEKLHRLSKPIGMDFSPLNLGLTNLAESKASSGRSKGLATSFHSGKAIFSEVQIQPSPHVCRAGFSSSPQKNPQRLRISTYC